MEVYRIIVTSSRDWTNYNEVARLLAIEFSNALDAGAKKVIVKHGGAKGGDSMAEEFVNKSQGRVPGLDIRHKIFYPDWNKNGLAAGPMRSKQMVEEGAEVCLVFQLPCIKKEHANMPAHPSHGAAQCAKMAKAAGIRVEYGRE